MPNKNPFMGLDVMLPKMLFSLLPASFSKELPITVTLHGEPEENMYLSEPKLSRETVIVSGPLSAGERCFKRSFDYAQDGCYFVTLEFFLAKMIKSLI